MNSILMRFYFRLGFILDFLSKATLTGFMAGVSIIVSLQQLKGLLGMTHFTNKMQVVPVMTSVFRHRQEVLKNNFIHICVLLYMCDFPTFESVWEQSPNFDSLTYLVVRWNLYNGHHFLGTSTNSKTNCE